MSHNNTGLTRLFKSYCKAKDADGLIFVYEHRDKWYSSLFCVNDNKEWGFTLFNIDPHLGYTKTEHTYPHISSLICKIMNIPKSRLGGKHYTYGRFSLFYSTCKHDCVGVTADGKLCEDESHQWMMLKDVKADAAKVERNKTPKTSSKRKREEEVVITPPKKKVVPVQLLTIKSCEVSDFVVKLAFKAPGKLFDAIWTYYTSIELSKMIDETYKDDTDLTTLSPFFVLDWQKCIEKNEKIDDMRDLKFESLDLDKTGDFCLERLSEMYTREKEEPPKSRAIRDQWIFMKSLYYFRLKQLHQLPANKYDREEMVERYISLFDFVKQYPLFYEYLEYVDLQLVRDNLCSIKKLFIVFPHFANFWAKK